MPESKNKTLSEGRLAIRQMLIDGNWVDAVDGAIIDVINPAIKEVCGRIPRGTGKDVALAVAAANKAFHSWKHVPPRDRGRALYAIADELENDTGDLALLLALESGSALRTQATPEIKIAADIFRYFAGLGGELKGETVPLNTSTLSYTVREPLGVVGAVIPWNAPVALAALKIAPALLSGNTMVMKASEEAPLAVLDMTRICAKHTPDGVLNVITGYGTECGAPLMEHPDVAKVTFTGSTEVGKSVMRAAAERIAPVSLELGGKSPNIVFSDMNEDWVADGAIAAARFSRQSQSCTTGSRLFVHKDIFDSFLQKVADKAAKLTIGDPLDPATDIGALINERQFNRVCGYIDEALATSGAELVTGGMPDTTGPLSKGFFTKPTIIAGVNNDWRLAQEEVFGPVIAAIPWSTEEEVIQLANESHYGLAAYIWTRDVGAALRTAHSIDAGFVQVNRAGGQSPGQSYGGFKQSGLGKEHSLEGMLESFTKKKSITFDMTVPPEAKNG